jgi:hypothetical protein
MLKSKYFFLDFDIYRDKEKSWWTYEKFETRRVCVYNLRLFTMLLFSSMSRAYDDSICHTITADNIVNSSLLRLIAISLREMWKLNLEFILNLFWF